MCLLVLNEEEKYRGIIFPSENDNTPHMSRSFTYKKVSETRYNAWEVEKKDSENRARHKGDSDGTS
jgi:hypothetical protein